LDSEKPEVHDAERRRDYGIGQLSVERIIEEKEPNDFVQLAKDSKVGLLRNYASVKAELEEGKTEKPPSRKLEEYVGRYWNGIRDFFLGVSVSGCQLRMTLQGSDDVPYHLLPYDGDTFYWARNQQEELCNHYRFPWTSTRSLSRSVRMA
jgi:hypothetical protein